MSYKIKAQPVTHIHRCPQTPKLVNPQALQQICSRPLTNLTNNKEIYSMLYEFHIISLILQLHTQYTLCLIQSKLQLTPERSVSNTTLYQNPFRSGGKGIREQMIVGTRYGLPFLRSIRGEQKRIDI